MINNFMHFECTIVSAVNLFSLSANEIALVSPNLDYKFTGAPDSHATTGRLAWLELSIDCNQWYI